MRKFRDDIMGMPIIVEIINGTGETVDAAFDYFKDIDERFSTYKNESEITKINQKKITEREYSKDMKEMFVLAEQTTRETDGYFSIIQNDGTIDPSGLVKGWAINRVAKLIESFEYRNYFLDVAGDIQSCGVNKEGKEWTIGIRNPFDESSIVKVISPRGHGVATSGTSIRGQHIYNPHKPESVIDDIVSLTVIGPDIYEADRFATAAFAMGGKGIAFIENLSGFEAYQINSEGIATMTSKFEQFIIC